jgi:DNA-binding NarL/FixJ family response regulator
VIRVLVADDHHFLRASVCCALNEAAGIEVVGDCADGCDVCELAAIVLPDVVVMDLRMPVMSGVDATRSLLAVQPAVRVMILTGSVSGEALTQMARAGAAGCLLKLGNPELLVSSVRKVAAGEPVWPMGYSEVSGPWPPVAAGPR